MKQPTNAQNFRFSRKVKKKGIRNSGINNIIIKQNNGKNVFNELGVSSEPIKIPANECVPNGKGMSVFDVFPKD
jgi:hypothetical protein